MLVLTKLELDKLINEQRRIIKLKFEAAISCLNDIKIAENKIEAYLIVRNHFDSSGDEQ